MKIGLIHERFRQDGGGLERYLHAFASALVKEGNEIHVITADGEPDSIEGAQLHSVDLPKTSKAGRLKAFADQSPRVVAGLGLDRTIGFGRTYQHDFHRAGAGCHAFFQTCLPWHKKVRGKNRLELDLEKRLYESGETETFVVNSELVGRHIRDFYEIGDHPIEVVRTGTDMERFSPGPPDSSLSSAKRGPVFLFVSLDHRRKGLDHLLQAFEQMTEGELWILGSKPGRSFARSIDKHPRKDAIQHFPTTDPVPFYRTADFYIHPTRYDACANTTLQSMACALPGILSPFDGGSELAVHGESGWILENLADPDCLAEAMKEAAKTDSEARKRIGEAARNAVCHLTWDHHLRIWETLLMSGR